jgi:hypothetical protein
LTALNKPLQPPAFSAQIAALITPCVSNSDDSTVRVHGDQASVWVYGSNDNASHPSDEQK